VSVRRTSALFCSCLLVAVTTLASPVYLTPASAASCPSGLVALTFDDGPSSTLTSKFLTLLHDRGVPGTFFVVGERVRTSPAVVRRAGRLGFVIGNHTYGHENLRQVSDAGIRSTLQRTHRAIRDAGARPSALMRPPYGSIDARVRRVVGAMGLVPVMWTADPQDWEDRSASNIAAGVLAQLRPRRTNVVLLHDGVQNSSATLAAMPRIITEARNRGYCFARLDDQGRPTLGTSTPVLRPGVRVEDASVHERPGGSVMRFVLALDRAAARRTSVRVRTVAGTATSGKDYVAHDERVWFPAGSRSRVVRVGVRDDLRDEPDERLTLRLSRARGLLVQDGTGAGLVVDDDPAPQVAVGSTEVAEPLTGTVDTAVELRLSRRSERSVTLTVATRPGTADESDYEPSQQTISLAPGQVQARFVVAVWADTLEEDTESFEVVVVEAVNARLGATGTVTILPPMS